jgi:mannose-6-phosphate isomerase-like protein (cupin superfamily)
MSDTPLARHYRFGRSRFARVRAHGGEHEISFARVLERARGPLRFIDLSVLAPGADIGRHTHTDDNEELYVVVEGRGLMSLDGAEFEVQPGDVILNRPGGSHGLRNLGDTELRIVVIEVDARREDG